MMNSEYSLCTRMEMDLSPMKARFSAKDTRAMQHSIAALRERHRKLVQQNRQLEALLDALF